MQVNTTQIQGSHGTVFGDCSLRNWWWMQQCKKECDNSQ